MLWFLFDGLLCRNWESHAWSHVVWQFSKSHKIKNARKSLMLKLPQTGLWVKIIKIKTITQSLILKEAVTTYSIDLRSILGTPHTFGFGFQFLLESILLISNFLDSVPFYSVINLIAIYLIIIVIFFDNCTLSSIIPTSVYLCFLSVLKD